MAPENAAAAPTASRIRLTASQRDALRERVRAATEWDVQARFWAVLQFGCFEGATPEEVAKCLGMPEAQVRTWIDHYRSGGLEALGRGPGT